MSLSLLVAWIVRHEVLAGWAAAALGALALFGATYALGRHAGGAAQAAKLAVAEDQARTAAAQTAVAQTAARAADTASVRAAALTRTAEESAHAVQAAEGADAPLSPDLLSRWRSGVDGLRGQAAPGADGAGGGQPARALPATGG